MRNDDPHALELLRIECDRARKRFESEARATLSLWQAYERWRPGAEFSSDLAAYPELAILWAAYLEARLAVEITAQSGWMRPSRWGSSRKQRSTANSNILSKCGIVWPVCPDCLGEGMPIFARTAKCSGCGHSWPAPRVTPCPWPAEVILNDDDGVTMLVCASHAAHPSLRGYDGSLLQPNEID